jgi:L-aminopeptidase/D-esterase-like protein
MPAMPAGFLPIGGLKIGHAQDMQGLTGCTVVVCEGGAAAACAVRGGAAGERELETLRPGHIVDCIHALVFAGGSAFGLDAASGVMRWLEQRGIGFDTGAARIPIVPAAILFDLRIGDAQCRPGRYSPSPLNGEGVDDRLPLRVCFATHA